MAVALSLLITSIDNDVGNRKRVIIGFTIVVLAGLLIPPPTENVKAWPIIGEKAYDYCNVV